MKKPKVIVKKLGRHKVDGFPVLGLTDTKTIEIDPRQKPKSYLDTIVHESIHVADPEMSETKVKAMAKVIRDILWDHNYRKVDL